MTKHVIYTLVLAAMVTSIVYASSEVTSWPTYILIDKQGNIAATNTNIMPTKLQLDKLLYK